jgi:hypothetical protein
LRRNQITLPDSVVDVGLLDSASIRSFAGGDLDQRKACDRDMDVSLHSVASKDEPELLNAVTA